MSEYPKLILRATNMITTTKLQQELLDLIGNDAVKRGVNQIIADRTEKYVPMESGALRRSVKVGPKTISWGSGLNYGRYQYGGVVYGPNFPIIDGGKATGFFKVGNVVHPIFTDGIITGWRSPAGKGSKHPTNRELGVPGEWRGWTFGYSTPGTKHHWVDEMLSHEKRSMQQQITRYLKAEAKKKNK